MQIYSGLTWQILPLVGVAIITNVYSTSYSNAIFITSIGKLLAINFVHTFL